MIYKRNSDLLTLVQSLNKSQRLLLSRKWSKEPYKSFLYVQLFNQLTKLKAYDSKQIVQLIPQLKPRQLGNVQNELYHKIMEQLRLHQENNYSEKYQELVQNHLILRGLNLPDQAEKWKNKAIAFYEKYNEICQAEFINEEVFYREGINKMAFEDDFNTPNLTVNQTTQILHSYLEFRRFYLNFRFTKDKNEHLLLKEKLKKNTSNLDLGQLSLADKILYYRMLYHYNYAQRNFVSCYRDASMLVKLYEDNSLDKRYNEIYLKFINYQLTILFRLNAKKKYTHHLSKFKKIQFSPTLLNYNRITNRHFIYELIHTLNIALIKGEFEEGLAEFEKRKDVFQAINTTNNMSFITGIYYKIACLYFGNSDFEICLSYLNKILLKLSVSARPDLQIFARILKLATLFELQETDYIFENIRAVYGYLARNKQLDKFSIEIMNFLRICTRLPESELMHEFQRLRNTMELLAQDTLERRAFYYFDIISWLDSKLEKKNLDEIIRERGLGHRIMQP